MTRIPLPRSPLILAAAALATVALGCSSGAEKARQVARADTLVRAQRYPDALAEARRVLQRDENDPTANHIAGLAYLELRQFAQAYHHLLMAQARAPDDKQVRTDLARLYLISGKIQDAHDLATAMLDDDSLHVPALVVFAATATTQRDIDESIRRLQAAESRFGNDPSPRLALATLLQRKSQSPAAGQPQQAGAAEPLGPVPYLLSGQRAQARRLLYRQIEQSSGDVGARRLLAEMSLADDSASVAEQLIAPILANDSTDVEALIQRGRAFMVQQKLNEAVRDYRRAQARAPKLAPIHYYLGAALARLDRDFDARAQFDSAIKLTRNYPEAVSDLSVINIRGQIPRASIANAERQVRINKWSLNARRVLGDVLVAADRSSEATETFREAVKLAQDRPEPHYWLGVSLSREKDKRVEAAREFEIALELAPEQIEPLAQLVGMDLADGHSDVAVQRITKHLRLVPSSAALYTLLGRTNAKRNEWDAAEAAFMKAIELDPGLVDTRVQLADAAVRRDKFELAIVHGEAARRIDPKNVSALTALGVAYQLKGDIPKAREAYEEALRVDPKYVPAVNDLAVLLSEFNIDQGAALKLAAVALKAAPNDPLIKDTAGWILYRVGQYNDAVTLLQESAQLVPDAPEIQYHLGMAAQKTGDTATARHALELAVASPANFRGKEEARKALALLK